MARAAKDEAFQQTLWDICKHDLLFYINCFVWTYDPRRKPGQKRIPFVTWPFQEEAALVINECIGSEDLVIEKSRDMGASWLVLIVFEWRWHFFPMESFLLVSRKEELVDKTEDPKCLMWKIDFIHKHQPGWLLPRMNRQKLHLANLSNGSTIDGESTTGDVGRGDRRGAILLDEFAAVENGPAVLAATGDTSPCRISASTPKGTGNAFYSEVERANSGKKRKLRFHWTAHPLKVRGLYYDEHGKPRSKWYDRECERRSHPMEIKQEVDIDYLGSNYQFFDQNQLDECERRDCCPAYVVGELDYSTDTLESAKFLERTDGAFKLWFWPDEHGKPPESEYVVAADIATGTGASNSCLTVLDKKTGEKVLAYACSKIRPEAFAALAVAVCKWFSTREHSPFLIWEATGPGRNFGDRVVELGYDNIYYRRNEQSISRKMSDVPGWWPTPDNKRACLGKYREALGNGSFINRDLDAIREAREYVYVPGSDTVEHARQTNTLDPSGARANHGDRVIADALAEKGREESGKIRVSQDQHEPPEGTFAYRRKHAGRKGRRRHLARR